MKTLVISNDDNLQKEIAALSAARTPAVTVIAVGGGLLDATQRIAAEAPQLVILDTSKADILGRGLLETFSAQYPQIAVMLLTQDQSPEILLRAMRAGVRELLLLPLEPQAFGEALDRIAQKNASSIKNGKIISFISCKGGSGATFIATNFGHALASLAKKKVLLIDLNQHFGDAALYMSDKKPTMTLSDICVQIDRIDPAFLDSSLVEVLPNFGILAASEDPTRTVDIKPEHIDTILLLARSHYDFVILDVGRQIDGITIRALDHSDAIYPVLQLAMPHIRDGRRLLDIFHSLGYPRDKTHLIVNRYEKTGKLHLSDLERALGGGAVHTIPNGYDAVNESINQGVPLLQLARGSAVAKSLIGFADRMTGTRTTEDKSILARLFSRSLQARA
ncbi:response regulator [Noviherbaspirillum saxi]|uniref:Response regulator n=2 Tax=Noviherbaspirillum saxi TaxID=2320863 RepID=A0A3A3FGV1_9BURK|nr:response regulator [Noviherbaspirillum saxi]